jgi:drug/metabolite transporter (DMT)-like permease
MALFRYLVASVCMFFIYWRTLNFRCIPWRDVAIALIMGICGFSIYNLGINYGEMTVSAGMTSFIISQVPVIITLLAIMFFGDRLTRLGWAGTLISVTGIFFIAFSEKTGIHFNMGVFYLLTAVCAGAIFSILQKSLLKRMHPIECTTLAIWFGTLGLIFYLPELIHEIPRASTIATITVIYNGIFPAAIAYLLWSYVSAKFPMSQVAVLLYLVPVVATLLGFLILKEIPTGLAIMGAIMTLIGAFLVSRNVSANTDKP